MVAGLILHIVSIYAFFDELDIAWTVGDRDVKHVNAVPSEAKQRIWTGRFLGF
jgi:hypothetical protein